MYSVPVNAYQDGTSSYRERPGQYKSSTEDNTGYETYGDTVAPPVGFSYNHKMAGEKTFVIE